ncbi:MAG: cadherin-like beta sandwich domain-containing protein, partial [Bacilli bacterium]|nr:cadherin-like beta sandwich domain-containing protein [Bacilli bacterium]
LNSVVITATAEDPNATITGDGLQKIETGENYFEIVVTSESGTEKKYTILINKEASDNNYLGSLFLSDGELTPEFDKETTNYGVTVPYTVSEITLTGDSEDSQATVTGLDTYTLVDGENTIVITVTSESGLVRTYTVKVTKEETISAYLTSLEAEGYELDTEFNKELFEYYITVGNEVTELDLSYTTEDKNATVVVTGNENFEIGMNEVHIEVTSSDGNLTEEYILYVNREFSTDNYLSSLLVDKGTLDPEFDPKTLTYSVEVDREVEKINVSAIAEDKSATIISGTGEHNLNIGNNVIQVKVRSSIGITRTYKINVLRKQSSNNYLSILTVSNKGTALTLTPNFDKLTNEYAINAGNDLNFVQIRAEAEDESATVVGSGTKQIATGSNRYEITVTAEDGSINTYILNITKEVSDNNYLSGLV